MNTNAKKAIISTTRFHTRICEKPARLITIAKPPIVPEQRRQEDDERAVVEHGRPVVRGPELVPGAAARAGPTRG